MPVLLMKRLSCTSPGWKDTQLGFGLKFGLSVFADSVCSMHVTCTIHVHVFVWSPKKLPHIFKCQMKP